MVFYWVHIAMRVWSRSKIFKKISNMKQGKVLAQCGSALQSIGILQDVLSHAAYGSMVQSLEQLSVQFKHFAAAKKKLDSKQTAYDTLLSKSRRAKTEKIELEDQLRTSKVKLSNAKQDVEHRLSEIIEAETESVQQYEDFVNALKAYHRDCLENLNHLKLDVGVAAKQAPDRPPLVVRPRQISNSSTQSSRKKSGDKLPFSDQEGHTADAARRRRHEMQSYDTLPEEKDEVSEDNTDIKAARLRSVSQHTIHSSPFANSAVNAALPASQPPRPSIPARLPKQRLANRHDTMATISDVENDKPPPKKPPRPAAPMPASLTTNNQSSRSKQSLRKEQATNTACQICTCDEFEENTFRPGQCMNCFHAHSNL